MQLTVETFIFGLPPGQCTSNVCLTIPTASLTVRELIAHKIRREFEECLSHRRPRLSGEYLKPEELLGGAERTAGVTTGAVADEIMRAQQAFAARAYMIVMDDRRLSALDEEITLRPMARVEFIKILFPVGG